MNPAGEPAGAHLYIYAPRAISATLRTTVPQVAAKSDAPALLRHVRAASQSPHSIPTVPTALAASCDPHIRSPHPQTAALIPARHQDASPRQGKHPGGPDHRLALVSVGACHRLASKWALPLYRSRGAQQEQEAQRDPRRGSPVLRALPRHAPTQQRGLAAKLREPGRSPVALERGSACSVYIYICKYI